MTTSPWFVYMILGSDQQLYTGITTDMARRWHEHTSGTTGARYFRGRTPALLCFLEAQQNRSDASKREYAIKTLKRSHKWQLINDSLPASLIVMASCVLHNIPCITTPLLSTTETKA